VKKIYIATPCMTGEVWVGYMKSVIATFMLLTKNGHEVQHDTMTGCSNICVARNVMLQDFMDGDADAILFIDADLSWPAEAALRLVRSPHDVIGGAYPAKQDDTFFLAKVKPSATRLMEADGLPGGFLKITRKAVKQMQDRFTDLRCTYKGGREMFTLFDNGIFDGEYLGEDYAFTRRWQQCGSKAFVDPDIQFEHYGRKAWSGSLSDHVREG
jgi:glycosyltransferase involved in cell wall biosynthesis